MRTEDNRIRLNLFRLLSQIYSTVVTSLFIGMESREETIDGVPFTSAALELNDIAMQLSLTPALVVFGPKVLKLNYNSLAKKFNVREGQVMDVLRKHVRKALKKHQEEKEAGRKDPPKSIIEHLIVEMEGRPDIERELMEEVYIFVMAGSDTTSSLTLSALYYLFENPEVLAKAR